MATGLHELLNQFKKGQLSYEQLANAMGSIALVQKPRGKDLADDYRIAELPYDDNDPIWLDSALDCKHITPEQHRELISRTRTPMLPGVSTPEL